MSGADRVSELDLHAFLDGELPEARMAEIAAALERDPALAERLAGFAADQKRLAATLGPLEHRALPARWTARIENASPARQSPVRPALAIAASILLLVAGGFGLRWALAPAGILQSASLARSGDMPAAASYDAAALTDPGARRALLRAALGMDVRVPDLSRAGYHLVAMKLYGGHAVGLQYRNAAARELTMFLRRSDGTARFDLLRQGKLRVCLWQDDVIGAVLSGEMSAGEMMRVASLAYSELNI